MVNRREFFGITVGAGATLTLTPRLLRAVQGGKLMQRGIPSSGEMLPVIGLTLANHASCADPTALKDVIKTFVDNGGKVFDNMHQSDPPAEMVNARIVNELGIQNKLFLSSRAVPSGGPAQSGAATVADYLEKVFANLKVPRLDLVMVNPAIDPAHLEVLKRLKKEGRLRYIGVQVGLSPGTPLLESVMRTEPVDFVGVHYAVDFRDAEKTILPLAQEREIAVMAYYPFGGADSSCPGVSAPPPSASRSLFTRVGTRPVPEWASEFDAKTWAQFFLKYVLSHPAVTVVRVGTTNTKHMLDDIAGGIGRLPNEAMRKRMAEYIDALPGGMPAPVPPITVAPEILDRYVGTYQTASGSIATFRRDGLRFFMKLGANPEVPVYARTETRFFFGPMFIEFQRDSGGTVTGLVVEQGNQKTAATRVP